MKVGLIRVAGAAALFALAAAGGLGSAPAHGADDEKFLSTIEDLPLMPGLAEDDSRALVFEAPAGRIAEAFAAGEVGRDAVVGFYRETLPQLGWTAENDTRFVREGEVLSLAIENLGPRTTVRFSLAPVAGGKKP